MVRAVPPMIAVLRQRRSGSGLEGDSAVLVSSEAIARACTSIWSYGGRSVMADRIMHHECAGNRKTFAAPTGSRRCAVHPRAPERPRLDPLHRRSRRAHGRRGGGVSRVAHALAICEARLRALDGRIARARRADGYLRAGEA